MTDDQQFAEVNMQLQWRLEQALREALTNGVSMSAMLDLCYVAGIPLSTITGEPK